MTERLCILRFAVLTSLLLCTLGLAQEDPTEKAKNLVVMLEGELQELETVGAGIAFGVARDRLYIATADHVVRRGDDEAAGLRAQFWQLPGESFDVTLLEPLDSSLDLAVLSIRLDELGLTEADFPFELLSADGLSEASTIFTVGYGSGRDWLTLVEDANVVDAQGGELEIQSTSVTQGDSGGGVFAEAGDLIGMIVRDQPPTLVAVATGTMLEALASNRYPVAEGSQPDEPAEPPVSAEPEPMPVETVSGNKLEVDGTKASSMFSARNSVNEALDGNTDTYWVSESGDVAGSFVTFLFRQDQTIDKLRIFFQAKPNNAQVQTATLSTPDGEKRQITFRGLDGWEEVSFDPLTADEFTLTLNEFFPKGSQSYASIYELELISP